MKNQVDAIQAFRITGVAHVLNSSLNKGDVERVKQDISSGITKLLYVAPESLKKEYVGFEKPKLSLLPLTTHCISDGDMIFVEYRNLKI